METNNKQKKTTKNTSVIQRVHRPFQAFGIERKNTKDPNDLYVLDLFYELSVNIKINIRGKIFDNNGWKIILLEEISAFIAKKVKEIKIKACTYFIDLLIVDLGDAGIYTLGKLLAIAFHFVWVAAKRAAYRMRIEKKRKISE